MWHIFKIFQLKPQPIWGRGGRRICLLLAVWCSMKSEGAAASPRVPEGKKCSEADVTGCSWTCIPGLRWTRLSTQSEKAMSLLLIWLLLFSLSVFQWDFCFAGMWSLVNGGIGLFLCIVDCLCYMETRGLFPLCLQRIVCWLSYVSSFCWFWNAFS